MSNFDELEDDIEEEDSTTTMSIPSTPSPSPSTGRFDSTKRKQIQQMLERNECVVQLSSSAERMNQVTINDQIIALQCDYCKSLFSPKTGGALKSHIEKCAGKTLNQVNYSMSMKEKKNFTLLLAELVTMDSRSFSLTQTDSFKRVIQQCINLGFKVGRHFPQFSAPIDVVPTRNTIKNHISGEVLQITDTLKLLLSSISNFRCAVVLDFTSLKYNYCGIVLHFMQNWSMKTVLISVIDCTGISTTSENIETIAREELLKFGIEWKNNFVITDEGANVIAAFRSDSCDSSAVCIPHSLNTTLKRTTDPYKRGGRNQVAVVLDDGVISKVISMNELIKKLKIIINSVKHSYKTYSMLDHPLVTDCDTRWLSKLTMVETWLKLNDEDKAVLRTYFNNDAGKRAILEELFQGQGDLQNYVLVLGLFRPYLRLLESEKEPTLNHVLLCYYKLRKHLESFLSSNNELVKSLATSCLAVLERKKSNFTHEMHYAACCLDIFQRSQIYQLCGLEEVQKAEDAIEKLFIAFVSKLNGSSNEETNPDSVDEYAIKPGNLDVSNEIISETAAKNELQMYLRYRPSAEQIAKKDILHFWSEAAARFPLLSQFASFILSVPASSASIERIFSVLTKTVTKDRRSLDASTVADLLLFKSMKMYVLFASVLSMNGKTGNDTTTIRIVLSSANLVMAGILILAYFRSKFKQNTTTNTNRITAELIRRTLVVQTLSDLFLNALAAIIVAISGEPATTYLGAFNRFLVSFDSVICALILLKCIRKMFVETNLLIPSSISAAQMAHAMYPLGPR
uniref:HAT C-terminal dimerisation domain-containing protein n=1 Tax=Panagrolaimus davidi TaxID=227884 RepID=A0A914QT34_9BILA